MGPTHLRRVLVGAVQLMMPLSRHERVRLTLDIAPEVPDRALTDAKRVTQVGARGGGIDAELR